MKRKNKKKGERRRMEDYKEGFCIDGKVGEREGKG